MTEQPKKLYRLECGIGTYWVVADDPAIAEAKLINLLNHADYGYTKDRIVKEIHFIAEESTDIKFITGKHLIL